MTAPAGELLRTVRRRHGLTRRRLADRASVASEAEFDPPPMLEVLGRHDEYRVLSDEVRAPRNEGEQ